LGELDEAIAAAASRADLGDTYAVTYVEREVTAREQLLIGLLARAEHVPGLRQAIAGNLASPRRLEAAVERLFGDHAELLAAAQAPGGLMAHCQCTVD
jgi:hypothetical protein